MRDKLTSVASRTLFAVACILAGGAILEKVANLFGYTIAMLGGYTPSRLLELAGVVLLFVIALQLREIRLVQKP